MYYKNVIGFPPAPAPHDPYHFPVMDCKIAEAFEAKGWQLRFEHNPHNDEVVSKHLHEALATRAGQS